MPTETCPLARFGLQARVCGIELCSCIPIWQATALVGYVHIKSMGWIVAHRVVAACR